ncbi:MAG: alpha/beta fold hydrolase [Alkalispirochaetaceae bacterium]
MSRQVDIGLYYEIHGDPGLPVLMLIHGNTASSAVFSAMLPSLSDKRRVLLVDLLGHGRSDRYRERPGHLWKTNALAIKELLEELHIPRLDVLGTSGGAIVAINLALIDPGRIRRLVADSFFGSRIRPEEAVSLAAGRERAMEEPELARFWASLHGSDWREVINSDTLAITEAAGRRLPLYVEDPGGLTIPVLVTGSREDELIPNVAERLGAFASRLPAAETIIFNRGGHPAMFSNATPFLAALEGFLGVP